MPAAKEQIRQIIAPHRFRIRLRDKVPLWEKYILTIQEATDYFHIGEKKQRKLVKEYDKKEKERLCGVLGLM